MSDQESPAIAIDDDGNIIVVWTALTLAACEPTAGHIYGRRLHWDGVTTPTFESEPFQIDNDPTVEIEDLTIANPAVAFTNQTQGFACGSFIVAWNVVVPGTFPLRREIHAQYFSFNSSPMGLEFRVNQDISETVSGSANIRLLADSAQHTIDYGPNGQAVIVWSTYDQMLAPIGVYYTLLLNDFAISQAQGVSCLKGDVNLDGLVNGSDIQPFVDILLGNAQCVTIQSLCAADTNCDLGLTNIFDVAPFVALLLGGPPCQGFGGCLTFGSQAPSDCNLNEVPDDTDILFCDAQTDPGLCDCNANGVPDECDIAACESDWTCGDVNENGIPDGCEPDCNGNEIPDDLDIADCDNDPECADCNANGIPDGCEMDCNLNGVPDDCDLDPTDPDGDLWVDPDCNQNGIPDACDSDCDANGVSDECDLDPTDPDGDLWVDPDCNGNGYPDSCDIDLGPGLFGSMDCNENGIPDECDIANCDPEVDPSLCDCNENGVPDGCDIAAEVSEDLDENGVPDECEQQQMMMMGGSSSSSTGEGGGESSGGESSGGEGLGGGEMSEAEMEAWGAFYLWCAEQTWGPASEYSGIEQYQRLLAKKAELGL